MPRVLVLASTFVVALAFTTAASASAENPNRVTFTLDCGAVGAFTGSQPGGTGGALLLESGGVAILQGLSDLGGETLIAPTPGLERQGKLVQCRFTFPGQPERIGFVLFAPANR